MNLSRLILTFIFICSMCISCSFSNDDHINYNIPLSRILDSLMIETSDIVVLIDKSDYKLSILSDTLIIKEYPVVLGGNPVDDKRMQGDQCTPEGSFHMVMKYPHDAWRKFIWLDYPTEDSWRKHKQAKQDGIIDENAKIGGEIGIHGVPEGMDNLIDIRHNWTLGCISLKNDDVDDIYPYISKETQIHIRK